MARFQNTTQKYDEEGRKVQKGLNGIKQHNIDYPNLMIFDSKSEYEIYSGLLAKQGAGLITELECKKSFLLVPKRKWYNNVKNKQDIIRELTYITDFVFKRDGVWIAVDCKGWKEVRDKKTGTLKWKAYYDEIYKIKKKLFLNMYPEYIFEEL